jgi:hypothetical protein
VAQEHLEGAAAMLVVGSSLMSYSGFRFAQAAARRGIPIARSISAGLADDLLAFQVEDWCEAALPSCRPLDRLYGQPIGASPSMFRVQLGT